MTLLHDLFQSLNPARQAEVLARCTVYKTRTPGRVAYESAADAHAHESGYASQSTRQFWSPKVHTPEYEGWLEAHYERRDQIRADELADERNDARRVERGESE